MVTKTIVRPLKRYMCIALIFFFFPFLCLTPKDSKNIRPGGVTAHARGCTSKRRVLAEDNLTYTYHKRETYPSLGKKLKTKRKEQINAADEFFFRPWPWLRSFICDDSSACHSSHAARSKFTGRIEIHTSPELKLTLLLMHFAPGGRTIAVYGCVSLLWLRFHVLADLNWTTVGFW